MIMQQLFRNSVQCSRCGKYMQPQLYDRALKEGGFLRAFDCPKCFMTFKVARITKLGMELTQQLQDTDIQDEKEIKRLRKLIKKEVTRP